MKRKFWICSLLMCPAVPTHRFLAHFKMNVDNRIYLQPNILSAQYSP